MRRSPRALSLASCLLVLSIACQPAAPAPPPVATTAPAQPAATTAAAKPAAPAATSAPAPTAVAKSAAAKPTNPTRVVVGQTSPLDSQDPLNNTETFLYTFWCELSGCLVGADPKTGEPMPMLATSWRVENPTTWVFKLRENAKWSDGTPFTAADVVYTMQAVQDHPAGKQKNRLSNIASVDAVDPTTVRIVARNPDATLVDSVFIFGIPILSKAQHDRGDDLAKQLPMSTGAYMLKEWVPGDRAVTAKNPNYWGGDPGGPDEIVYRYIKEDQARLVSLLNNEIQIAKNVPSQDVERLNASNSARSVTVQALSNQFLAMHAQTKPWDNLKLRQAVNYAIDKDAIIKSVLNGYAERLDGPVGPGQYAYTPEIGPQYAFDPARARQLVAEAGYPNGLDVELSTPVNFLIKDVEISQAMAQMLTTVGIRTKLLTPEFSTLFSNIQAGTVPFFYLGRGQWRDADAPLAQYFETSTPSRIGFSNPEIDELFKRQRATFEPEARKKLLVELMSKLQEQAPVVFLWRYSHIWGVSRNVEWAPRSDEAIFGSEIRLRS